MSNTWGGPREFQSGPPQEQHVPVHGFNAGESKGALRRGKQLAIGFRFLSGHSC
jgi:hypothetical protein